MRNKNQERFVRHTSLKGEGQFLNSAPIREIPAYLKRLATNEPGLYGCSHLFRHQLMFSVPPGSHLTLLSSVTLSSFLVALIRGLFTPFEAPFFTRDKMVV